MKKTLTLLLLLQAVLSFSQDAKPYKDQSGKYGFIDGDNIIIAPKYDYACEFQNGLSPVNMGGKEVEKFNNSTRYRYIVGGKWGFVDRKGKEVIAPKFNTYEFIFHRLLKVKLNDKYGLLDSNTRELAAPIYSSIANFEDGFACFCVGGKPEKGRFGSTITGGKWGLIDPTGKVIIPAKYDNQFYYKKDGLILIKLNGKYGYIDQNDKIVIEPKYDYADDFNEQGIAQVAFKNKFGFINKNDTPVIPFKYNFYVFYAKGLAPVSEGGKIKVDEDGDSILVNSKWYYIDITGKKAFSQSFEEAEIFDSEYTRVKIKGKWGLIDSVGKMVLPAQFDYIEKDDWSRQYFTPNINYVRVNKGGSKVKWKPSEQKSDFDIYNMSHEPSDSVDFVLVYSKFEMTDMLYSGRTSYVFPIKGGKWGFVDRTGKEIIPIKYDWVEFPSNGISIVREDKKYGLVDSTGKEIVAPKYEMIKDSYDGFFSINIGGKYIKDSLFGSTYSGGKWGMIDRTGKEIIAPKYSNEFYFYDDQPAEIVYNGKRGYISKAGQEIITPAYDQIESSTIFADDEILKPVVLKGKKGMISINRKKEVVSPQYDFVDYAGENMFWVGVIDGSSLKDNPESTDTVKWGLVNSKGIEVLKPMYSSISTFNNGIAVVTLKNKSGLINKKGKEIVATKYDKIETLTTGGNFRKISLNNKVGLIDLTGKEIIAPKYDEVDDSFDRFFMARSGKKWGFVNMNGIEFIPAKYDQVYPFDSFGLARVIQNKKWGYVDTSGKIIVAPKYDEIEGFDDSYERARVKLNNKWGFINAQGKEVIPPTYTSAEYFYYHLIPVNAGGSATYTEYGSIDNVEGGKWGFIDTLGKIVIPIIYDHVGSLSEGIIAVEKNKKFGFIDENNKPVTGLVYQNAYNFENGFGLIKQNEKWGAINRSGQVVVPCEFESMGAFKDGYSIFSLNNKKGLVDTIGKVIAAAKYDDIGKFEGNITRFLSDNKLGLISKQGKELTSAKYEAINPFYNGYASVLQEEKWGVVAANGIEVVPTKYEEIRRINEGFIEAKQDGEYGMLNKNGKEIIPNKFAEVLYVGEGIIAVKNHSYKWGLYDTNGVQLLKAKYDEVNNFIDGLAVVKQNELWGAIDKTAKEVTGVKYKKASNIGFGYIVAVETCVDSIDDENGKFYTICKPQLINRNNTVINTTYDYIGPFYEGLAIIEQKGKYGFIDKDLKVVIPIEYEAAGAFSNGSAEVILNGKYFRVDKNGKKVD